MFAAALLLAVLLLSPCSAAQESDEQAPSFSPDSIVNSANGSPDSLAPNVIATVYGLNLAYSTETAPLGLSAATVPSKLGGVQVRVGGILAPLLYASPTQINFLIPGSLLPARTSVLIVRQASSAQAQVTLHDVAPALFLVEGGKLAATHVDGKLITVESPALPGEIIVVYGDGLGPIKPRPEDGEIPRSAAWITRIDQFRVLLGEQLLLPANVLYAGVAPGFPGLYQINLRLPDILVTKQPDLRVGFENQMSQSGVPLQVTSSEP